MNIPLNPDSKNPIWTFFGKVIKLIDSRGFKQEKQELSRTRHKA